MDLCFNGQFLPAHQPVITAQNRSFKWGDGIFETIKVQDGKILLASLHFDRLFQGLQLLQIHADEGLRPEALHASILGLCHRNQCAALARVRLSVFRNEQNAGEYLIEALPLSADVNKWPERGLAVDIYPLARKSMDALANLKSANYLPYVLAALHAGAHQWDEALVLNAAGRLCDASKANLFLVRNGELCTPPLSEGCIAGVARKWLIAQMRERGQDVQERIVSEDDLLQADEVFLTNAVQGMRWIASFRGKQYQSRFTHALYDEFFSTIHR